MKAIRATYHTPNTFLHLVPLNAPEKIKDALVYVGADALGSPRC